GRRARRRHGAPPNADAAGSRTAHRAPDRRGAGAVRLARLRAAARFHVDGRRPPARQRRERMTFPKIELHVHLEGTVRADTLRAIAKRNDYALPDDLESLYRFRDFRHFIEVWILTTNALQTEDDFRRMVVDYAEEAASHGAVYLEGIFS